MGLLQQGAPQQQEPQQPQGMAPPQGQQPEQQGQQGVLAQGNDQQVDQVEQELTGDLNVKLSPAQESQLQAYEDNVSIVVFSEETQPDILQRLQSQQDPVASIAEAAFFIHKHILESGLAESGENMTEPTMLYGGIHLVSELVVLSEAAKLYTLDHEQRLEALRQSFQKYFKEGLVDGSIDVVELQKTVEPLMTDAQRSAGTQAMEQNNVLKTAPPSGGMQNGV